MFLFLISFSCGLLRIMYKPSIEFVHYIIINSFWQGDVGTYDWLKCVLIVP